MYTQWHRAAAPEWRRTDASDAIAWSVAAAVRWSGPDAESLMRSRYTAFVLERGQYLLDTWFIQNRPAVMDFDRGVKWLGLEVRRHRQIDQNHAQVEFVARNRASGRASRLHEVSRFAREGVRWVYVDGDLHGVREGV